MADIDIRAAQEPGDGPRLHLWERVGARVPARARMPAPGVLVAVGDGDAMIDVTRVLDLVTDAVIALDAHDRITSWNQAAEAIYGWTRDQAMGHKLHELVPFTYVDDDPADVALAITTTGVWRGDVEQVDRAGRRHIVNTAVSVVVDDSGAVVGKLGVNRDVTEWRHAEAAAAANHSRLASLVEHGSEVISVLSEGRLSYVSPAAVSMLGFAPEHLVGRVGAELLHPDDVEATRVAIASLPDRPTGAAAAEFRIRRADGTWCWVEAYFSDLRQDPAVAGIVINCRDITDRKQAEKLLAGEAQILGMVAAGRPLPETLARVAQLLRDAAPRLRVAIHEIGEGDALRAAADALLPRSLAAAIESLPAERLFGWSDDQARDVEVLRHTMVASSELDELARAYGLGAWAVFPIRDGIEPRPAAALTVFWPPGGDLAPAELLSCRHYRHLAEMAIGRSRVDAELVYHSQRDPLSGLYNLSATVEKITASLARRGRGTSAVLALGLDHFKSINANFGHTAGDEVLRAVGDLLQVVAGTDAVVGRVGGDEFLIYVEQLRNEHDAVRVGAALRRAFSLPFGVNDSQISLTASVGVTVAPEGATVKVAELVRDADLAMRRAKTLGRDRTELFDEELRVRADLRQLVEQGLEHALDERQFEAHFQPVVDMASGTVHGVEVLIRWNHPTLGLLPPSSFIGVAEETGAIVAMGRWILVTACREAAAWRSLRPDRPLRVAVNLSARQLEDELLPAFVAEVLAETELEPALLCLEITESVLMGDAETSVAVLRRLKSLGVRLAIDDFGTGYSSMAYLKRFPVDELKIDQSFVSGLGREPEDTAIVTAILGLARALGLEVVAEGVETAVQAQELLRMGAHVGQGYLWSRPLTAQGIEVALRSPALVPAQHFGADGPDVPVAPTDDPVPDDVVAVLAHELRTPLTVISGYADTIEMLDRSEDRAAAFASVRRNVTRMLSVLDSFNALRDLDQGSLELHRERVALDSLVLDAARDAEPNLGRHTLELGSLPTCGLDVDVARIQQVLVNLLTNAAKYSPAGTTVSLCAECAAAEAVIVVADEGPGIPAPQVAVAFRKFGRLDRRSRGTGIGLYLARGFARAHGGDLTYRNRPTGGSEFRLVLPLA